MDSNHQYHLQIISDDAGLNNSYLASDAAAHTGRGSLKILASRDDENRILVRPAEGDGATALRMETGDATRQRFLGVMGPSGIGPWELQGLSRLKPFGLGSTLHYRPWVVFQGGKFGTDLVKLQDDAIADGGWYAFPGESDGSQTWTVRWVVPLPWRPEFPGPDAVEIGLRLSKA